MANLEDAYEVGGGGIIISLAETRLVWIGGGASDPSVGGQEAPLGSIYYKTDGQQFTKLGPLDSDWGQTFANVFSGITPPLFLNHNGNLSNGQLIGTTNLVNNPIVMGFRGKLIRVTFINTKSTADAGFRFYKGTETPANLFHTWSFDNKFSDVEEIPGSPIFEVGDLCRIYFDDEGQNPSDMTMGLFFEAVPL